MKHVASPDFWACYEALPELVRDLADNNFSLPKSNPRHPSLRFKKVGEFWSARVGIACRALGRAVPEGVAWFWIGSHAEYDRLTKGG